MEKVLRLAAFQGSPSTYTGAEDQSQRRKGTRRRWIREVWGLKRNRATERAPTSCVWDIDTQVASCGKYKQAHLGDRVYNLRHLSPSKRRFVFLADLVACCGWAGIGSNKQRTANKGLAVCQSRQPVSLAETKLVCCCLPTFASVGLIRVFSLRKYPTGAEQRGKENHQRRA